jgi:hypothetical protein
LARNLHIICNIYLNTTDIQQRPEAEEQEKRFYRKESRMNRIVYRNKDGQWANKRTDADKAGSLHETQKAAQDAARTMLKREGGGELTTKGRDGKINSKDTIAPGNDPCPPKDREH